MRLIISCQRIRDHTHLRLTMDLTNIVQQQKIFFESGVTRRACFVGVESTVSSV